MYLKRGALKKGVLNNGAIYLPLILQIMKLIYSANTKIMIKPSKFDSKGYVGVVEMIQPHSMTGILKSSISTCL